MHKLILLIFFLVTLVSCKNEYNHSNFTLNGKSKLMIQNSTKDSLHISISNWLEIPIKEEIYDTVIAQHENLDIHLKTQNRKYFDVTINEKELSLFTVPNSINKIEILDRDIIFEGDDSEINQFLEKRKVDYTSRSSWYQGKGSVAELVTAFDSITKVQIKEIHQETNLPNWYKEFEIKRIGYINAQSKLSGIGYRKKMLGKGDIVPENYLENVVKDIQIEDSTFLGVAEYMQFLNWYTIYKEDPFLDYKIPSSKKEWLDFSSNKIESIKKNISEKRIQEILLTRHLSYVGEQHHYLFDKNWIKLISDKELVQLLNNQLLENILLPKGEKSPYFYLSDIDSNFYEPSSFKGKIVLINFWATWCKPCYHEFEYENKLVENFKNQPVEIINICIESDRGKWEKVVHKYDLKTRNLYAPETWSENINRNFGATALPHSVLIDADGKVIMNKCPRPSGDIKEMIDEELLKIQKLASSQKESIPMEF